MYGIYANIWGILMVNVTIYTIHGSYGIQESFDLSTKNTVLLCFLVDFFWDAPVQPRSQRLGTDKDSRQKSLHSLSVMGHVIYLTELMLIIHIILRHIT